MTLKVYSDTAPGTYRFQACADGAGDIAESDQNNNCLTLPRVIVVRESPDLLAIAVVRTAGDGDTGPEDSGHEHDQERRNGALHRVDHPLLCRRDRWIGEARPQRQADPPRHQPGELVHREGHGKRPNRDGSGHLLLAGVRRLREGPGREEREQQLHHLAQGDSCDGTPGPGGHVDRAERSAADQGPARRLDLRGDHRGESGPRTGGRIGVSGLPHRYGHRCEQGSEGAPVGIRPSTRPSPRS